MFSKSFFKLIWIFIILCIMGQIYIYTYFDIVKNISPSEKLGYYLLTNKPKDIKRGDLYIICLTDKQNYLRIMNKLGLPHSNYCENGYLSILKEIIAVPNDIVELRKNGLFVNNHLVTDLLPLKIYKNIDLKSQKIGYSSKLKHNQYWVLGRGTHSYDSRYFGAVTYSELKKKAQFIF